MNVIPETLGLVSIGSAYANEQLTVASGKHGGFAAQSPEHLNTYVESRKARE